MAPVITRAAGLFCITLYNSFNFFKSEYDEVLDVVCSRYPNHFVIQTRSRKSMKREMAVHNFLHGLGYKKSRTAHTDFNSPLSFWEKVGYGICGPICLLLIK